MTLELRTPLVSLNTLKGRHWSARHRGKGAFESELLGERFNQTRARRHVTVTRLLYPRERAFDFENLAGGNAKALIDALTERGAFVDDNPAWLERRYEQRKATADEITRHIRTIVRISDASEVTQ